MDKLELERNRPLVLTQQTGYVEPRQELTQSEKEVLAALEASVTEEQIARINALKAGYAARPDDGLELVTRLQAGFQSSLDDALAQRDNQRLKRLSLGCIKKSKVMGVNSPEAVKLLIQDCATATAPLSQHPHPRDAQLTVYRFEVPPNWKAFGRCIRIGELLGLNSKFGEFVKTVPRGWAVSSGKASRLVQFQAPQLSPFQTKVVTFVYNERNNKLQDWFAGEDPTSFPVVSNETVWVHCGVDLLLEK